MKRLERNEKNTLEKYLNGQLSSQEASRFEEYIATNDELLDGIDASNEVGETLRSLDPSRGLFEDVDLSMQITAKILSLQTKTRSLFNKLLIGSIAAAILVAFLAAFLLPSTSKPKFSYCTPSIAHADGLEISYPDSDSWSALTTSSNLSPGCEVRTCSALALIEFSDGSTLSLRDGTVLEIGGDSDRNYSFMLLHGEIRADLRGSLYAIATNPTSLQCREGQFVLYADDPIICPPRFTDACSAFTRTGKRMTILTVSLGSVISGSEKFIEGSRRDWPFEEEKSTTFAELKR